ncbi:MAG: hemerythrin domain-containing protein [Thiohalorhabdaceae bacterium]
MPECGHTVTGFFQADHRRLDDVYERYQQAKEGGGDALVHFEELADGLRRHIAWEETHLFPFFEERTGMSHGGPTEVMRREHRQIEGLLEALRDDLKGGSPDSSGENDDVLLDMPGPVPSPLLGRGWVTAWGCRWMPGSGKPLSKATFLCLLLPIGVEGVNGQGRGGQKPAVVRPAAEPPA